MTQRQTAVDTLAAKLDALVLTAAELEALDALFAAALGDDADVTGFAIDRPSSVDHYANQEISYFRPRLRTILGHYIGETEKNL